MKSHKERVQEYVREQIPALKELSFGCEVDIRMGQTYFVIYESPTDNSCDRHFDLVNRKGQVEELVTSDVIEIIGHPITHADLLRALPIQYNVRHGGDKLGITVAKTTVFSIPLNYRTIEDIPEDDPCWEQLCRLFNLTK